VVIAQVIQLVEKSLGLKNPRLHLKVAALKGHQVRPHEGQGFVDWKEIMGRIDQRDPAPLDFFDGRRAQLNHVL
jgi:hypothetical protein